MRIDVEKVDVNGYRFTFEKNIGGGHSNLLSFVLTGGQVNRLMVNPQETPNLRDQTL